MTEPKTPAIEVNWSHGRPRCELRRPSDGGTPALPETVETAPVRDIKTGRWIKGNGAARHRSLKTRADGIATLNPSACEPWLRGSVEDGAAYAMELLTRFPDPALARLVGNTADAHTMYRALLSLAAKGDGSGKCLTEARGWLNEHRACLRELASLAGFAKKKAAPGDASAEIAAVHAREAAERASR